MMLGDLLAEFDNEASADEALLALGDLRLVAAVRQRAAAEGVEPGTIVVRAVRHYAERAPDEEWVVDPAALHHKNPVTPYAGRTLTGTVRQTWLRGTPVDVAGPPRGRLLRRGVPLR